MQSNRCGTGELFKKKPLRLTLSSWESVTSGTAFEEFSLFFRSTGWPIVLVLFYGTVLKRPQLTIPEPGYRPIIHAYYLILFSFGCPSAQLENGSFG